MNRELLVFVDLARDPVPCGRLWVRARPRESASFEYDPAWIKRPDGFALDPELPRTAGQFHTARSLFRAFMDPAPDRWGQTLLRRAEQARARQEGGSPRTLRAPDFLTLVDDETRLGALRFRDASDKDKAKFLSSSRRPIPPVFELPRLLSATARITADKETDADLALVLAPGTSLGGARPKASVREPGGELAVAKFPRHDDEWPVTRWEAVALSLAAAAGIHVPKFRLEQITKKAVLLLHRFDRHAATRIPFMSAMTALSADDGDLRSYLELAEVLRREGSRAKLDLQELWRRMTFNVLISNTDDHLRNHGFLHDGNGWRLAPAYDLNPVPTDVRPRVHALALDETDQTSSLDTALRVAPMFGLSKTEARTIVRQVASSVRKWGSIGTKLGLSARQLARMESAFEHDDLTAAAK